MKVEKEKIKEIVDTLPIGFYAHTRVEVKMDNNAPTSYFCPNTREIFISTKIIQDTLDKIQEDNPDIIDKLIRGQVYHELSHAILTPQSLPCDDIFNIFEDERIEYLLKNYYHNVDFKWQIKTVCDFDNLQPPHSPKENFFQIIRFGVGKEEFVEQAMEIIENFQHLNWNTPFWSQVANYTKAIKQLFLQVRDDYNQNKTPTQEEFQKQKQKAMNNSGNEGNVDIPEEYQSCQKEEQENGQSQEKGQNQCQEGKEEENKIAEEKGKLAGNGLADELFNHALEKRIDRVFYQQVENILHSFQKKNCGGGAVNSYSGVFNPRSAGREDFRYFDRKTAVRSSNRYGSFHLNLFIDDSGSFEDNMIKANQIICVLLELEKKYPFFSVDFALCGDEVKFCKDKAKVRVTAQDGTGIQRGADKIVKNMQKSNTFNYNIVLYDGTAHSQYGYGQVYKPFDLKNTTLILDTSCEQDSETVKNAKVIICRNYLSELQNAILKTLQNALR